MITSLVYLCLQVAVVAVAFAGLLTHLATAASLPKYDSIAITLKQKVRSPVYADCSCSIVLVALETAGCGRVNLGVWECVCVAGGGEFVVCCVRGVCVGRVRSGPNAKPLAECPCPFAPFPLPDHPVGERQHHRGTHQLHGSRGGRAQRDAIHHCGAFCAHSRHQWQPLASCCSASPFPRTPQHILFAFASWVGRCPREWLPLSVN